MSVLSALREISFRPSIFVRIVIFLMAAFFAYLSVKVVFRPESWSLEFRIASGVMGAAMLGIAIMCLKREWYASRFFGSLCVVALASMCGEFVSFSLQDAMSGKNVDFLLLIPVVVIVCGLPLFFAWGRLESWMCYLGLAVAMSLSWLFICTLTGWWSLAGLGLAVLAFVWPAGAISLVGALLIVPLAAIGAGGIGSYNALHKR